MATRFVNVEAFISRPSFRVYRFILNFINALLEHKKVSHLSLPVIVHLQGLTVRGQARDAHEALLIDLEHTLEVAVDGHQLGGKTRICRNSHAVLALHGKHGVSVILVLYRAKENINSQYL